MKKKYIVNLSDTQRQMLRDCVEKGKTTAYKIRHAHILLKADAEGPGWSDAEIAEAFGCHAQTVYNVRRRFVVFQKEGAGTCRFSVDLQNGKTIRTPLIWY